jgi:hypothetical protein
MFRRFLGRLQGTVKRGLKAWIEPRQSGNGLEKKRANSRARSVAVLIRKGPFETHPKGP